MKNPYDPDSTTDPSALTSEPPADEVISVTWGMFKQVHDLARSALFCAAMVEARSLARAFAARHRRKPGRKDWRRMEDEGIAFAASFVGDEEDKAAFVRESSKARDRAELAADGGEVLFDDTE